MKFFIEFGSCDFDTLVPLAKNGWHGIIIEPVPELFNNISRHPNVVYENCAISTFNGETFIKYYDPNWAKDWKRGVGSISGKNIFNKNPKLKQHERTAKVKCYTLDKIIERYNVSQIDFLKIDVEGIEKDILENYSFKIKPTFIKCEYIHWKGQRESVFKKLKKLGYLITPSVADFFAIC